MKRGGGELFFFLDNKMFPFLYQFQKNLFILIFFQAFPNFNISIIIINLVANFHIVITIAQSSGVKPIDLIELNLTHSDSRNKPVFCCRSLCAKMAHKLKQLFCNGMDWTEFSASEFGAFID